MHQSTLFKEYQVSSEQIKMMGRNVLKGMMKILLWLNGLQLYCVLLIQLMADKPSNIQHADKGRQQLIGLVTSEPRHQTNESKQKVQTIDIHKKRKRKHHRKPRIVRDPEQIKSIRLQRLNVKREVQWDSHFINETIPDLFKPKKKRPEHVSRKRPLQSAYVEKERPKLPELPKQRHETASKSNGRAFKIRHLKKEAEGATITKQQEKKDSFKEEVEKLTKKISRRQKNKERLLLKLQEKTKIYPIHKQYRSLITDLIHKSADKKYKQVRANIEKQIDSIGSDNNSYSRLDMLVKERLAMLSAIKTCGPATTLKQYLDFQMHSLALIEEILKFKAYWEGIYHDTLHAPTKVNYFYKDSNYLITMTKDVAEIAENDPFLVNKTAKLLSPEPKQEQLRERKQMALKVRACELLLIEEELQTAL